MSKIGTKGVQRWRLAIDACNVENEDEQSIHVPASMQAGASSSFFELHETSTRWRGAWPVAASSSLPTPCSLTVLEVFARASNYGHDGVRYSHARASRTQPAILRSSERPPRQAHTGELQPRRAVRTLASRTTWRPRTCSW